MKIVLDRGAFPPIRAHADDAGLDLRSPIDIMVRPGESVFIDTGVHVEIPPGYVGFLKSKSGLMAHHELTAGEGVIDSGYTGSIRVRVCNAGQWHYMVHQGDKITQMVILPCITPEVEIVGELEETERGNDGFGSSGR